MKSLFFVMSTQCVFCDVVTKTCIIIDMPLRLQPWEQFSFITSSVSLPQKYSIMKQRNVACSASHSHMEKLFL
jgi:hypothetical protein